MTADALIRAYYAAFNAGDFAGMVALLTEDVIHDINQGGRETGRAAFTAFMARMAASYRERLEDIVVMTEPSGTRAAAGIHRARDVSGGRNRNACGAWAGLCAAGWSVLCGS